MRARSTNGKNIFYANIKVNIWQTAHNNNNKKAKTMLVCSECECFSSPAFFVLLVSRSILGRNAVVSHGSYINMRSRNEIWKIEIFFGVFFFFTAANEIYSINIMFYAINFIEICALFSLLNCLWNVYAYFFSRWLRIPFLLMLEPKIKRKIEVIKKNDDADKNMTDKKNVGVKPRAANSTSICDYSKKKEKKTTCVIKADKGSERRIKQQ